MGHTPGPWVVRNHPDFGHLLVVIAPQYRKECDANHVVAELRPWQRPDPDPNARLIAAAPELLAALRDLMALYKQGQLVIEGEADEGDDPVIGAAFAAIAKAEGRSE